MELKKDTQVKFSIWLNNELIIDNNAEVFTTTEHDDTLFVFLKDPNGKEVKIKIEITIIIIKKILEKVETNNDKSIILGIEIINSFINDDIVSNINE
jgi:hypothetical protein